MSGGRYGADVGFLPVAAPAVDGPVDAVADRGPVRILLELPDRLPVVLGCLTLSALVAVLLGAFRPMVVLPAAVVLVVLTWRWVPRWADADRWALRSVAALGVLVAGWTAWGVARAGEYVVVNRDPGFLTLKAWWLTEHASAPIPVGSAAGAAVAGASAGTEAFALQGDALLAQGNSALPAVLAVVGWAGGPPAVLWANVAVGAFGIVAVHATARRVVGSRWALLAAATLALTLPFLAFSRSAYTEPLVLALTFGGVALVLGGIARPTAGRFALAGGLLGTAAAVRIDGAVIVVAAALGLASAVLLARGSDRRRRLARSAVAGLAALLVTAALGLVDLVVLSPVYVQEHGSLLLALMVASGVGVAAVAVVVTLPAVRERLHAALARRARTFGTVAQVLVVVAGVALATRPWWLVTHGNPADGGVAWAVARLQEAEGIPVDGTRTYDEMTVTWLAWYLGWPTLVAALGGATLLVRRAVRRRDGLAAWLVITVAVGSALYLVRPSITSDQIWAARRLVPVAIPGAALLAVVLIAAIGALRHRWSTVVATVLAAAMLVLPLTTWPRMAQERELFGQLGLAERICGVLETAGTERVVWVHSSPWRYLATLRVICGVEVVEFVRPPSADQLASVARVWADEPVALLSFDAADVGLPAEDSRVVPTTVSRQWGRRLGGPPRGAVTLETAVFGARLGADGSLTPLLVP